MHTKVPPDLLQFAHLGHRLDGANLWDTLTWLLFYEA